MPEPDRKFHHTWEQAISILRSDPLHQKLVYDAYLTADLTGNCRRFAESPEFGEVVRLIEAYRPGSRDVLDVPAGNGIATFAFAKLGFAVVGVEPDPSSSVGRGAIATALNSEGLKARIIDAFGEKLPFQENSFDVVYVRQGLHHAQDLKAMLSEYARVLRPGGLLLACREHVVDDYGSSLQAFLDSQVDHQLYGGENAFTLADYREALSSAAFRLVAQFGPYDSVINLHPNTEDSLLDKVRDSRPGKLLGLVFPRSIVNRIGMWYLRRSSRPGRLYSFVAVAP